MSLKNRLTLVIILILIITMGILTFSSMNKVTSVFSLEKLSTLSQSHNSPLIENSPETSIALQNLLSSSRNVFNVSLVTVFVILLIISSLTVYLVVFFSLKSLSNLQKKMKNADANSLGEPLKIVKSDPSEIKALTLSFNKMSKKLNDTFLKQQLFLHNAAHEFRTPLTLISTYSQLLNMELSDNQQQEKEMIATVLENCSHLEEMITQLLLLAEDKQVELDDIIDIQELFKKVENELFILSQKKKMILKIQIPDGLIIRGNRNLLFIAFKNLIENAIKYGETNSEVVINVNESDKQINFSITNKSIFSNNVSSSKIFEAFNRGDNINNSVSGQGLGLAIVKQIVLQHSGQVNFDISEPFVTFTISINKRV